AERLFSESFRTARDRYRARLTETGGRTPQLANTDFDTGRPPAWGEYRLADETYAELLDKLAAQKFTAVSGPLKRDLIRFLGGARVPKVRQQIQGLQAAAD